MEKGLFNNLWLDYIIIVKQFIYLHNVLCEDNGGGPERRPFDSRDKNMIN